jgi:hypothetical protein
MCIEIRRLEFENEHLVGGVDSFSRVSSGPEELIPLTARPVLVKYFQIWSTAQGYPSSMYLSTRSASTSFQSTSTGSTLYITYLSP